LQRCYETIILLGNQFIHPEIFLYEMVGFVDDFFPIVAFSLLAFILLISRLIKPRVVQYLVLGVFCCYMILNLVLQSYFCMLLYPVDRLILNMPIKDILETALSSSDKVYIEIVPFIVAIAVTFSIFVVVKRILSNNYLICIVLGGYWHWGLS